MKRAALLLLVCLGASCGAPVAEDLGAASCTDPVVLGAAGEAMDKINKARTEGYVFAVRNLANAHVQKHGENGAVFYLTMNVLETNCSVLSRRHFKACTVRDISGTPVYGQCKVAIFISRVNRVVRLYKYNCVVRPAAAAKVSAICPDCPSHIDKDNEEVKKTISKTLEKFNKESGLAKYFSLLQVERATAGYGMGMMYFVQYSIQETTCANGAEIPADCPPLSCEFGHKGFCKGSHVHAVTPDGEERYNVECEIFEPEAAETEKKLHQTSDHSHTHTHGPGDHSHDHSHDHAHGPHSHTHSHDHSHAHHSHLHDHEHHHHDHHHGPGQHHHGTATTTTARSPEGVWRQTAALGGPVTLPAFPDVPAGPEVGVTLPAQPDPQIPGQTEPTIGPFPASVSDKCPLPAVVDEDDFEANLFVEDPEFTVGSQ